MRRDERGTHVREESNRTECSQHIGLIFIVLSGMFPKLRHGWNFLRPLHFLSSEADARSPGRDVRCAQLPSIRVVASIDASY